MIQLQHSVLLVLSFLLLILSPAPASAFFFKAERVHLLDTQPIGSSGCSAYLFRGAMPIDEDLNFVYDELLSAMTDAASVVDVVFTKNNLKLLDFTLLDPTRDYEIPWLNVERQFFADDPSKGTLFETPMHGSTVDPYLLPSKAQNELGVAYKDWSKDHLPALIDSLNYLLTGDSSSLLNHADTLDEFSLFGFGFDALSASVQPADGTCSDIAIYFHCHYGQDRTGEVAGSYLLTYGGFLQSYAVPVPSPNTFTRGIPATLQQLVKMNEQVAGGHIVKHNQKALSWTCFSLVALGDSAHKNLDCSLNYELDPADKSSGNKNNANTFVQESSASTMSLPLSSVLFLFASLLCLFF